MKYLLLFLLPFCVYAQTEAKTKKINFGLGVILGSPTAISANYFYTGSDSIDGAIAWFNNSKETFRFHVDKLWHKRNYWKVEGQNLHWHYGVGVRYIDWDRVKHPRTDNDDVFLGPRFPLGISYMFSQPTIEILAEIAPVFEIIPGTDLDLDVGIGARYYF